MKRSIIKIALSSTLATGLVLSGVGPVHSVMAGGVLAETGTAFTMSPIMEDNYGSNGQYVSEFVSYQDPLLTETGIAVTGMDNAYGNWQYWNAGASQWYNIPSVSSGAFLLSASHQIRFVPAKDWNGTAAITYKLWDEGSGGYAALAQNVNTTESPAFSTETETAVINVLPVNDAPSLTEVSGGNYYLGFNGHGDQVSIPDFRLYGNSFTVEGYLKADGFNTWMRFFESSVSEGHYNVFVGFDHKHMNFSAYSNGSIDPGRNNFTTSDEFPQSQWVHTAFVYDHVAKKGYIYWDGVLKGEGPVDLSAIGNVPRPNNWLGKSTWSQDGYFVGGMKDVRFWSKAKTQQEIVNEMNTNINGTETGLVANYKLNASRDDAIAVSTPEGRDGSINGGTWVQSEGFVGPAITDKNRTVTRSFKVIDPDQGDIVQTTATSSNPGLVSNSNLVISGSGEDRTLSITPEPNAYGTATITVTVNDGTLSRDYSFNLIVNDTGSVIVTGIALDTYHLDLTVGGESKPLHAMVTPDNALNRNVIWTSEDETIATVNEAGVVTPVGPGNTTITATTEDGHYPATATINVAGKPDAPTEVTAIPGNGQVTINFKPPVNNGESPIIEYKVNVSPGGQTVTGVSSPITITGLNNGTDYTFTVVATNRAGDSEPSSPSQSVAPIPPAPGAPVMLPAIAGDSEVTLAWDEVQGATGYKLLQRETVDGAETEVATINARDCSYKVTGLTNGKTYYYVVKAMNEGQESAASLPVSATPVGVPAAPTNVTAVAGNGQAILTFTAPTQDGGSPITGYEVTSSPGNVTVTGGSSPITVTGLTNGTSYTFTIKAVNGVGSSPAALSNAVVPSLPISSGTGSGSGGGSGTSTPASPAPVTPPTPAVQPAAGSNLVDVLVNGKAESAGTATFSKREEQAVTTISVDQNKLENKLAAEGQNAVVTVGVNDKSGIIVSELNGQMVKNMESKQAVLEIKTEKASYTLPAKQINIDSVSEQVGKSIALKDIKVQVEIAVPTQAMAKTVENAATKGAFTVTVPPVDFTVRGIYGDKTIEVSKFNAYVERLIAIPEGVDPNKITTGVVVQPDGSVRHVPTEVVVIGGKYFAKINSLTNSTYSVVWHPIEFADVVNHWAKSAVNDMGSRMVVDGVGGGLFDPNKNITRAEFAAIVVRGLGLELNEKGNVFPDVHSTDWYSGAIGTANSYQLIEGFEDGMFRPNDQITREQAMVIIAKAMEITKLKEKLDGSTGQSTLPSYADGSAAAKWAQEAIADCLQTGIVTGRSSKELAPKSFITRAEVAAIVQRLLHKSDLI